MGQSEFFSDLTFFKRYIRAQSLPRHRLCSLTVELRSGGGLGHVTKTNPVKQSVAPHSVQCARKRKSPVGWTSACLDGRMVGCLARGAITVIYDLSSGDVHSQVGTFSQYTCIGRSGSLRRDDVEC